MCVMNHCDNFEEKIDLISFKDLKVGQFAEGAGAVQGQRENSKHTRSRFHRKGERVMKNILHISLNDPRPSWEYKTRSRYIVKPELVQELDIHQVTRSLPGFQTLELPREHVSLAHFRWFITFVCIVCRIIYSCPRNWEKGKVFPGLDEEHKEDQNLIQNITPRLLDRVDKVILATTHAYG